MTELSLLRDVVRLNPTQKPPSGLPTTCVLVSLAVTLEMTWPQSKRRMRIQLEPIGIVQNAVGEGSDDNWGQIVSEIRLRPELADGLTEVGQFSHVVVVFYMSDARFDASTHLV